MILSEYSLQRIALEVFYRYPGLEGDAIGIADHMRTITDEWMPFLNHRIYSILRTMESLGILTTRPSGPVADRGNRPRIFYRLKHSISPQRVISHERG